MANSRAGQAAVCDSTSVSDGLLLFIALVLFVAQLEVFFTTAGRTRSPSPSLTRGQSSGCDRREGVLAGSRTNTPPRWAGKTPLPGPLLTSLTALQT